MRAILFVVLSFALVSTHLDAHGGQYKGPADAGSSASTKKGDSNAPTNPGGMAGSGPGNPYGGGNPGGTSGNYDRMGNNRGGADKQQTTGGGCDSESDYEVWEFWWENNKDRFLDLKGKLAGSTSVTGSPNLITGRGRFEAAGASRGPSSEMILREVVPVLRSLAADSTDTDIIDSAILALGRVTRSQDAATVHDTAMKLLGHGELSVQAAATLALGVLGSSEATPLLRDLLADASRGRQVLGGGQVPWLVRSFAALSLGLVGDERGVEALLDAVARLDDADRDIRVCALVGLSLVRDEALAARVAADLETRLGPRGMDSLTQSYVPTTLGKLGQRSSLEPVLAAFLDRDTNNLVRQSAAIALGRLATVEDERALDALIDCVREGSDMQTRHFAFISLGKIGARDEVPEAHAEAHESILGLLSREISKPDRRTNRSWAALSAAIYGRAHVAAQPDLIDRLTVAYEKERDPSYKAAFALSLGLLEARSAAAAIHEDFLETKDRDFLGYAAVALGFLKRTEAADVLRSTVRDRSTPPTFRLQAATGLGLMADRQAVDVLVDTLQSAQTLGVSSAAAKALGLIGDRAALPPLLGLAQDDGESELTRAFAAVALGIVGEKTELPWNAAISEDNNYRARVAAMEEVLDIL